MDLSSNGKEFKSVYHIDSKCSTIAEREFLRKAFDKFKVSQIIFWMIAYKNIV